MRSGHGRAAGSRICVIAGIAGRARARARGCDIRFYPVATIDSNWTAAAKASDGIRAGSQRADRIGCRVNSRRICHRGTTRPAVLRRCHHHDSGGSLSFNSGLQRVSRATFRSRATPGVNRNIRRFGRIAFIGRAADRVRCEEEFHAFDVPGRCAVTHVHVAASDPLGAGRHPDLVTSTIIADRCAGGVRAVKEIITREWRIVAARIADAVMD